MEAEIFVCVDADGNCWTHTDWDALNELLVEDGANNIRRIIQLNIKLPLPTAIEVAVELPAESNEASVKVS